MKSKIAYVIQDLNYGGIPTFLLNLAPRLKDFDLHFIATQNPKIHPAFKSNGAAYYCPKNLVGLLKSINPNILQYGNLVEYKNAGLAAGIPVLIERTAGPRSCHLDKMGVTWVVASSEGSVDLIRKRYKGPITVIRNGVDLGVMGEVKPERFHFKDSDFVLAYVARFGGVGQGHLDLLKAFSIVRRKHPVKLVLVGDKPAHAAQNILPTVRKALGKWGGDCIMTGAVDDPKSIIKGADLYVCPAHHHGISNSLIEAAALGTPVVATRVGQTDEVIDGNGFLVPPKSPEKLAQGIIKAIEYPELNRLGQMGLSLVERRFDINKQSQKYIELYRTLSCE